MNRLQVSGLILAVIFIGLSIYSGTFADPYYDRDYKVSIDESVDPQYTQYQYTELSPSSQRLFDQNTGVKERTADVEADERYEADVCREFTIVCDGYLPQNLPEEFEYANTINRESIIVQNDGTEYYFSVRRSDYLPAADPFGPDGEEIAVGFLRLLTLLTGLFIGTVIIDSAYELNFQKRKQQAKIVTGLIAIIATILSIYFLLDTGLPPNNIIPILVQTLISFILISAIVTTVSLIPILLGMKLEKNRKSIQKSIIGGTVIAGLVFLTPYFEMYGIISVGLCRQICLLFFITYILGVFSDYIKAIVFESPRRPAE